MPVKTPIPYPPTVGPSHLPLSPPQTPNPGTSVASQASQASHTSTEASHQSSAVNPPAERAPDTPTSATSAQLVHHDQGKPKLDGVHQDGVKQMIKHFGKEGYTLNGQELSVEEQMYLVGGDLEGYGNDHRSRLTLSSVSQQSSEGMHRSARKRACPWLRNAEWHCRQMPPGRKVQGRLSHPPS